jgi:S-formylglutathione hydrolase FrmB
MVSALQETPMPSNPRLPASLACLALVLSSVLSARQAPAPPQGTVERLTVHGRSLEGNLEGNSPDRTVFVYLPPGYATETRRRYPVVYFLHGYAATADTYLRLLELPESADRAIAAGARAAIVVLPDALTKNNGSLYSNSPTIGDWETFIAQDLPAVIDMQYRTVPSRESRGLAGHSMGGYGALRIGMKQPGAFGALYAMSSCCLMEDPAPARGAGRRSGARGNAPASMVPAQAAAWAPNPGNPPDFFDLPTKSGLLQPLVAAKWTANAALIMVDQYVPALKSMRAIALDVGRRDNFADANRDLGDALTRLGVQYTLEVYDGDHTSRVRERFETQLLPFFARRLSDR